MPRKHTLFTISLLMSSALLFADQTPPTQTLKSNYQLIDMHATQNADNLTQMFSKGSFFGRLRSNTFIYQYNSEDATHDNQLISGLGGLLVYKSANYHDFTFAGGLYYSKALYNAAVNPYALLKAGKDVFSRFDFSNTQNSEMAVLGQAYLAYHGMKASEIAVGRQLVETFYTKSNDSKMIPNSFEAITLHTHVLPKTTIKLGYLASQKLRDHSQFHALLTYGDANSSSAVNPAYSGNDDSVMHKGLSYSALKAAGKATDAPLIVGDLHNSSIKNLKIDAAFYTVPTLLSEVMTEVNVRFPLGQKNSLTPGIRYIKQIDNGAGAIGGASYSGNATGYKNPNSLESQMIAARIVAKIAAYKINLGFTQVLDEADLITPWRGFPTAGYTRSMARYNWKANTQSYRLEVVHNQNKKGIYKKLFTQASLLYTNADENKSGKDEIYTYVGFIQNVPVLLPLQWRLRLGYAHYLNNSDSTYDNLDARFELNYLF